MTQGEELDSVDMHLLGGLSEIGSNLAQLLQLYESKIKGYIANSIIYNVPSNAFDELKETPVKNWFLRALVRCGKLTTESAKGIEISLKTQQFKQLGVSPYVFARPAKIWADRIAGEFERAYDAMVYLSEDVKTKAPEILETFTLAISTANFMSLNMSQGYLPLGRYNQMVSQVQNLAYRVLGKIKQIISYTQTYEAWKKQSTSGITFEEIDVRPSDLTTRSVEVSSLGGKVQAEGEEVIVSIGGTDVPLSDIREETDKDTKEKKVEENTKVEETKDQQRDLIDVQAIDPVKLSEISNADRKMILAEVVGDLRRKGFPMESESGDSIVKKLGIAQPTISKHLNENRTDRMRDGNFKKVLEQAVKLGYNISDFLSFAETKYKLEKLDEKNIKPERPKESTGDDEEEIEDE